MRISFVSRSITATVHVKLPCHRKMVLVAPSMQHYLLMLTLLVAASRVSGIIALPLLLLLLSNSVLEMKLVVHSFVSFFLMQIAMTLWIQMEIFQSPSTYSSIILMAMWLVFQQNSLNLCLLRELMVVGILSRQG